MSEDLETQLRMLIHLARNASVEWADWRRKYQEDNLGGAEPHVRTFPSAGQSVIRILASTHRKGLILYNDKGTGAGDDCFVRLGDDKDPSASEFSFRMTPGSQPLSIELLSPLYRGEVRAVFATGNGGGILCVTDLK